MRDLWRKRGQRVRQRTANRVSNQNLLTRQTGSAINSNRINTLDTKQVDELLTHPDLSLLVLDALNNEAEIQI